MTLQTATGLPTTTGITLVIDATDPVSGAVTANLKEVVTGTLSGSVVSNLVRGQDGTTQQAHSAGANVVMWWTASMVNDFMNSFLTQHKQLGTHTGITTDTINATGNAVVGGTLGVSGATSLAGAITGAGFAATTFSNPYKFNVYLASAFTPTLTTNTVIPYDTRNFDTSSSVDITTHKGRFTAPVNGFYQFNAVSLGFSASSGTTLGGITLYKNGSQILLGTYSGTTAGTGPQCYVVSNLLQLAIGDYIEVLVYQGVGPQALTTGSIYQNFSGFLVSAT
jgi:hypothetical protein